MNQGDVLMDNKNKEAFFKAATLVRRSQYAIALTGAGMSVDSAIPDFRSAGGLWTKYNPAEYATIEAFKKDPEKVWKMLDEMFAIITRAKPNPGHIALARLEEMGFVKAVITQNIDNLHQEGGSAKVIEFHGNGSFLSCLSGHGKWSADQVEKTREENGVWPPRCPTCNEILKPDVVFFGEMIPQEPLRTSNFHAQNADLVLVLGTSATVAPASHLPFVVKHRGGAVIEFNLERTELSDSAEVILSGSTSVTVKALVDILES